MSSDGDQIVRDRLFRFQKEPPTPSGDTMDITFGTIPLVVLAFKGYQKVQDFATEYKSFDDEVQRILRDIKIADWIFKHYVEKMLEEVIPEDTRGIMFENMESDHWKQPDFDAQLEGILGGGFEILKDCIRRTQETLQKTTKLLLHLSDNKAGSSRNTSTIERLTKNAALVATSVLATGRFPPFKDYQTRSTRRKLVGVAKGHQRELERLYNDLRKQNREFGVVLDHVRDRKSKLRTTSIHQISPPPQRAENPTSDITRVCLNRRAVQTASERLYRITSQALLCKCHLIHLRLDGQVEQQPIVKGLRGKSKQPSHLAESETRFSFQLMAKSNGGSNMSFSSIAQPIRFVFTGCHFEDTDSVPKDNAQTPICKELLSSNQGYERRLRDNSGSSNSGFLLRLESCSRIAGSSNSVPSLSLDGLIASRPADLRSFDRLLIAANLAYSLVHFYSSPWVADWSLQTIHYFEKQESTTTIGLWTPHLSLKCNNSDLRQFGVKNKEVHSLGLILLQLGGRRRLEIPQGEKEEFVLGNALKDLCHEMGNMYMNFVRNCLESWSERSMDLMKDQNLDEFLSHVSLLEEQAKLFTV